MIKTRRLGMTTVYAFLARHSSDRPKGSEWRRSHMASSSISLRNAELMILGNGNSSVRTWGSRTTARRIRRYSIAGNVRRRDAVRLPDRLKPGILHQLQQFRFFVAAFMMQRHVMQCSKGSCGQVRR